MRSIKITETAVIFDLRELKDILEMVCFYRRCLKDFSLKHKIKPNDWLVDDAASGSMFANLSHLIDKMEKNENE